MPINRSNTKTAKGATKNMATKAKAAKAAPAKAAATQTNGNTNTAIARRQPAQMQRGGNIRKYAGVGLNTIEQRHLAVPFMYLLQPGSPQVKKRNEAYIEGAEAGMFLYTLDGSVFESVTVIPCYFYDNIVEWYRRDSGKSGLAKIHNTPNMQEAERNRVGSNKETDLVLTYNFVVFIVDDEGNFHPALFPCTSTKIRPARAWLAQLTSYRWEDEDGEPFPAPIYARTWQLTSQYFQSGGNDWYNFNAEALDDIADNDEVLEKCNQLYQAFEGGKARPDFSTSGVTVNEGATEEHDPNY